MVNEFRWIKIGKSFGMHGFPKVNFQNNPRIILFKKVYGGLIVM